MVRVLLLREAVKLQTPSATPKGRTGNTDLCHVVVTFGEDPMRHREVSLFATNIKDIQEVLAPQPSHAPVAGSFPPPTPNTIPAPTPPVASPALIDPAIVSLGRRPSPMQRKPAAVEKASSVRSRASPALGDSSKENRPTVASVEAGLAGLAISGGAKARETKSAPPKGGQKQTAARRVQGQPQRRSKQDLRESQPSPHAKQEPKGDGWRQTPILQHSFQPYASLKRRKGAQADNGWASEDVTDIQEHGDFDFEGGLAKFDKHTIFEQMRREDDVDEADRLVSHNRIQRARPGTDGGRNYHHTENVLEKASVPLKATPEVPDDFWNSEADDAPKQERPVLREHGGSGRSYKRTDSRASGSRKAQSRKASAAGPGVQGTVRVNSGVSHRALPGL